MLAAKQRRPDLWALAAVGAIAIAPRTLFLLRAPIFLTNDSLSYLLPGFDLVTGQGFEPIFKRPPGYSGVIAAALWFFGQQNLIGLLAVQHLLGIISALLAYCLGAALFGRAAGWLAGLLSALSGPLIVTEHYLMSEALFGFLLTATVLAAALGYRGRSRSWIALAGGCLGLAALTRPVAQLLLPLLALLCLVHWPRWRPALTPIGLLLAGYALVVLPWMVRNASVQQSFTIAGGLGEDLAVRTIRLDQDFDFRDPGVGDDRLRVERRIYLEEASQGSAFELARRLRTEAGLTPAEADRAMRDIALGAILQRPWYYLSGSWDMFLKMFAGRPVRPRQDWQPWRGIQWEERVQHLLPVATPEQERDFGLVQGVVTLYDPARWPIVVAALFAVGSFAAARRSERWTGLLPAVTALGLLFASAYLVGIEWRYRFPLDPLINVTLAGGVAALGSLLSAVRRQRSSRDSAPAATDLLPVHSEHSEESATV